MLNEDRLNHLRHIAIAQMRLNQANEMLRNYRATGKVFYEEFHGKTITYDFSMLLPETIEQVLEWEVERATHHLQNVIAKGNKHEHSEH